MKKYILQVLLFVFFYMQVPAQTIQHCASMEKISFLHQLNPAQLKSNSIPIEKKETHQVLIVPVVVHIIYRTSEQNISDDLIQLQLNILNRDFRRNNKDTSETPQAFRALAADCEIEFCLAKQDPFGKPTNGITRKQTTLSEIGSSNNFFLSAQGGEDIWDRNSYLNIWVCEIKLNGGLLGFSTLPVYNPLRDRDGVVIDYRYFGNSTNTHFNKGRTCTHEIGHWFNLFHIWGDDGGFCIGDDEVADTPNQGSEHNGKPEFPTLDQCSPNYPGTMFMNYLDYTDDASMNMFTNGQKQRMWAAINTTFRDSLKQSKGCVPTSSDADEILIYPNPSAAFFKIYFYLNTPTSFKITVYDLFGKKILEDAIENAQVYSESLDLTNFSCGVYLLKISSLEKSIIQKIIKN